MLLPIMTGRYNTSYTIDVWLYQQQPDKHLKDILIAALGIKEVVLKTRRIWFVNNVKILFGKLERLGEFVEVEAITWEENNE